MPEEISELAPESVNIMSTGFGATTDAVEAVVDGHDHSHTHVVHHNNHDHIHNGSCCAASGHDHSVNSSAVVVDHRHSHAHTTVPSDDVTAAVETVLAAKPTAWKSRSALVSFLLLQQCEF